MARPNHHRGQSTMKARHKSKSSRQRPTLQTTQRSRAALGITKRTKLSKPRRCPTRSGTHWTLGWHSRAPPAFLRCPTQPTQTTHTINRQLAEATRPCMQILRRRRPRWAGRINTWQARIRTCIKLASERSTSRWKICWMRTWAASKTTTASKYRPLSTKRSKRCWTRACWAASKRWGPSLRKSSRRLQNWWQFHQRFTRRNWRSNSCTRSLKVANIGTTGKTKSTSRSSMRMSRTQSCSWCKKRS